MTETSPVVTLARKGNYKIGSCGVLVANTKGKIVDLDTGKALGPNERGELCVNGPQVIISCRNDWTSKVILFLYRPPVVQHTCLKI